MYAPHCEEVTSAPWVLQPQDIDRSAGQQGQSERRLLARTGSKFLLNGGNN